MVDKKILRDLLDLYQESYDNLVTSGTPYGRWAFEELGNKLREAVGLDADK